MAKSGGGTRQGGANNPTGVGGYRLSRYAHGATNFDTWEEYIKARDRMAQDLQGFAEREGLEFNSNMIEAVINTDGHFGRVGIKVAQIPSMPYQSNNGLMYRLDLLSSRNPLYGTDDFGEYNEARRELQGRTFETLEEAYDYAKKVINKANRMNIG